MRICGNVCNSEMFKVIGERVQRSEAQLAYLFNRGVSISCQKHYKFATDIQACIQLKNTESSSLPL
jgi:hypothetical protein